MREGKGRKAVVRGTAGLVLLAGLAAGGAGAASSPAGTEVRPDAVKIAAKADASLAAGNFTGMTDEQLRAYVASTAGESAVLADLIAHTRKCVSENEANLKTETVPQVKSAIRATLGECRTVLAAREKQLARNDELVAAAKSKLAGHEVAVVSTPVVSGTGLADVSGHDVFDATFALKGTKGASAGTVSVSVADEAAGTELDVAGSTVDVKLTSPAGKVVVNRELPVKDGKVAVPVAVAGSGKWTLTVAADVTGETVTEVSRGGKVVSRRAEESEKPVSADLTFFVR